MGRWSQNGLCALSSWPPNDLFHTVSELLFPRNNPNMFPLGLPIIIPLSIPSFPLGFPSIVSSWSHNYYALGASPKASHTRCAFVGALRAGLWSFQLGHGWIHGGCCQIDTNIGSTYELHFEIQQLQTIALSYLVSVEA